jgi:hypothetical protein
MNKQGRSQLALGMILILIGAWFLLDKMKPEFFAPLEKYTEWPLNMFLIGGAILVIGLVTGNPGMAVPAAIVAGIGGIFYYQELTKSTETWSYMWTLIPGFVGVGTVLKGLLGDNPAHSFKHGLNMMVISAVLFLIFASYFGGLTVLGNYGPAILLMLLGVWVLGRGIYRSYRNRDE